MEVLVINNPLKIIKCSGTFKEELNINEYYINLIPTYMDISRGIWNISLDTYCIKSTTATPLKCIVEVSTNLVTAYKYKGTNNDTFESIPAPLGHMVAYDTMKSFEHFEKKWFTIESGSGGAFKLMLSQNETMKEKDVNFQFEITILFQRIR